MVVRVIKQRQDFLISLRLPHRPAECFLGEILEDRFHGLEVVFGLIGRGQEHHDGVHRELVAGFKVDPPLAETDPGGKLGDLGVLDVWNRNPVPKPSRGLAFSFKDFGQQFIADICWCGSAGNQQVDHLGDRVVSISRLEITADGTGLNYLC